MALTSPQDESHQKFQMKIIEILGKGFKNKQTHNFMDDIEKSKQAYKISDPEIAFLVMKAVLSVPCLENEEYFLNTLRDVLNFYQDILKGHVTSYTSNIDCLNAVEQCSLNSDHMKDREATAFIIQFLYQAHIIDLQCCLDFFEQLEETESPLLEQASMKVLITWLQNEASNYSFNWTEEDDNRPLSYWMHRGAELANMRPMYVWVRHDGEPPYNPLYLWVRKPDEQPGSGGVHPQAAEQNEEEEGEQNEEEGEQNEEQEGGQHGEEQFETYDDDVLSDTDDELNTDYELDINGRPLKYLTKNFLGGYPVARS